MGKRNKGAKFDTRGFKQEFPVPVGGRERRCHAQRLAGLGYESEKPLRFSKGALALAKLCAAHLIQPWMEQAQRWGAMQRGGRNKFRLTPKDLADSMAQGPPLTYEALTKADKAVYNAIAKDKQEQDDYDDEKGCDRVSSSAVNG